MEISIRPQMLSTVNYSLQQNRLSVIRAVTIDNPGEEISGATLLIKSSPAVFEDITLPLDLIPGGREYEINDIRVVLDAAHAGSSSFDSIHGFTGYPVGPVVIDFA